MGYRNAAQFVRRVFHQKSKQRGTLNVSEIERLTAEEIAHGVRLMVRRRWPIPVELWRRCSAQDQAWLRSMGYLYKRALGRAGVPHVMTGDLLVQFGTVTVGEAGARL